MQIPESLEAVSKAQSERNQLLVAKGGHYWQTEAYAETCSKHQRQLLAKGEHNFQSEVFTAATSARNKQQVTCPHCLKTGGRGGMQVHHFDNCLQHPDNLGLTRQQIKAKRQAL